MSKIALCCLFVRRGHTELLEGHCRCGFVGRSGDQHQHGACGAVKQRAAAHGSGQPTGHRYRTTPTCTGKLHRQNRGVVWDTLWPMWIRNAWKERANSAAVGNWKWLSNSRKLFRKASFRVIPHQFTVQTAESVPPFWLTKYFFLIACCTDPRFLSGRGGRAQ